VWYDTDSLLTDIDEIETLATKLLRGVLLQGFQSVDRSFYSRLFGEQELIELALRMKVREHFKTALRDRLEPGLLERFQEVLFGIMYPAPPR
jgi:hypothetical protein